MFVMTTNTSVPLAKMTSAVNTQQGSVTLPIRGISNALMLSHVKGVPVSSQGEGISVTRAVVLNSILKRLTAAQQVTVSDEYQKVASNNTALENFVQYLKDLLENSKEYAHGTFAATRIPQGFIVDKLV